MSADDVRDEPSPDSELPPFHPEGPSPEEIAAAEALGDDEGQVPCPACGREVYATATKCPGCGHLFEAGVEQRRDARWLAIGGLMLAVGLAVVRMWRRMR